MPFRFERFMAMRYLRTAQGREEGRRFLRFITYVAIGGVAVGVAALLLALSVVRGFSSEIRSKIVGFGAHVQVESFQDAPLQDADNLRASLEALEGVAGVAPVIQEFALLRRTAENIDGVAIWGTERLPRYIAEHLTDGQGQLVSDTAAMPGLVIGAKLASLLGLSVGDRVTAFSMRGMEEAASRRPRIKQFAVTGVYETLLSNFDEIYAFTDLASARALHDYHHDEVTRFDLNLHDVKQASFVAQSIEESHGFPVMARTIFEVFSGLFAWVNLQESIIPLVIGVIIIVAAFNIVGTLLMMILEKTREIGVLASMGGSARAIRRMFLWLGVFIGVAGTLIGESIALLLAVLQQRYDLIPLPAEAYYMKSAPIELQALDFVVVGIIALILCAAAAHIPARVAARIEPIRAIRFR